MSIAAEQKKSWEWLLSGATEKKSVILQCRVAKRRYVDESEESGYPNIKIPCPDGSVIRVYKGSRMKYFKVQVLEPVTFSYSGIPTFEPSGRRSI